MIERVNIVLRLRDMLFSGSPTVEIERFIQRYRMTHDEVRRASRHPNASPGSFERAGMSAEADPSPGPEFDDSPVEWDNGWGDPGTHNLACRLVVRWFLARQWCAAAIDEIGGLSIPNPECRPDFEPSDPTWKARSDAWRDRDRAWRVSPEAGGGQLDVLAISQPNTKRPRIAIAEIKVTRSDLRADIRAGKMLRYQVQGTHLYLALGPEIAATKKAALDAAKDLPEHWGVLRLSSKSVRLDRRPKMCPAGPQPTRDRLNMLAWKIATSASYRRLNDHESIQRLMASLMNRSE